MRHIIKSQSIKGFGQINVQPPFYYVSINYCSKCVLTSKNNIYIKSSLIAKTDSTHAYMNCYVTDIS